MTKAPHEYPGPIITDAQHTLKKLADEMIDLHYDYHEVRVALRTLYTKVCNQQPIENADLDAARIALEGKR